MLQDAKIFVSCSPGLPCYGKFESMHFLANHPSAQPIVNDTRSCFSLKHWRSVYLMSLNSPDMLRSFVDMLVQSDLPDSSDARADGQAKDFLRC